MSVLEFFLLAVGTFFVVATFAVMAMAVVLVRLHRVERAKEQEQDQDRIRVLQHRAARRSEGG